ncbi:hypothetical protein FNV43_RR24720 [Rhamnella rubrinervis]|uniref:Uncharacterized protein n=1 Tax=Rhamnella rubrinervis TaxID=2594499 RepID=A0A8K0GLH0_9ROSA|nr:hypothetical protein FNV43_RR24720 [Rhamnella rubrinervis]
MVETTSTTAGKKSTGPMAIGSTSSLNKKKPIGSVAVVDINEHKETDEPVVPSDESSIDDFLYQIRGLGDLVAVVDNTRRYVPPPARLGHQDQYDHERNDQGEIYVAGLNDQNGRNDDATCQNGKQNLPINL